MRPASRPLCSWLLPKVAEMASLLCTLKPIGSAPNLSWSARVFAVVWVNEPVICGLPSVMTAFVVGAEMMRPSSTIANWFFTPVSALSRVVTAANSLVPVALNTMLTAHWPVLTPWLLELSPLVASVIVSPATSTGPRMYLYWPASSQVMSGFFGSATFVFAASTLSQVKSVNCC